MQTNNIIWFRVQILNGSDAMRLCVSVKCMLSGFDLFRDLYLIKLSLQTLKVSTRTVIATTPVNLCISLSLSLSLSQSEYLLQIAAHWAGFCTQVQSRSTRKKSHIFSHFSKFSVPIAKSKARVRILFVYGNNHTNEALTIGVHITNVQIVKKGEEIQTVKMEQM